MQFPALHDIIVVTNKTHNSIGIEGSEYYVLSIICTQAGTIAQFQNIHIQPQTIDLSTYEALENTL